MGLATNFLEMLLTINTCLHQTRRYTQIPFGPEERQTLNLRSFPVKVGRLGENEGESGVC